MRITLTCDYLDDAGSGTPFAVTIESGPDPSLSDALELYASFLRACGYPVESSEYLQLADEYEDSLGTGNSGRELRERGEQALKEAMRKAEENA